MYQAGKSVKMVSGLLVILVEVSSLPQTSRPLLGGVLGARLWLPFLSALESSLQVCFRFFFRHRNSMSLLCYGSMKKEEHNFPTSKMGTVFFSSHGWQLLHIPMKYMPMSACRKISCKFFFITNVHSSYG